MIIQPYHVISQIFQIFSKAHMYAGGEFYISTNAPKKSILAGFPTQTHLKAGGAKLRLPYTDRNLLLCQTLHPLVLESWPCGGPRQSFPPLSVLIQLQGGRKGTVLQTKDGEIDGEMMPYFHTTLGCYEPSNDVEMRNIESQTLPISIEVIPKQ